MIHERARAACSTTTPPACCRSSRPGSRSSTPRAAAPPTRSSRAGTQNGRRPRRPVIMSTADHDFARMGCGIPDHRQLGAARRSCSPGRRAVHLLRRRDRHAVPARHAERRGRHGATPPTTGPGAAPRCSGTTGRTPASPRPTPADLYLPVDADPDRPDGGRAGGRPRRDAHTWSAGCSRCAGDPGARRPRAHPGAERGLSVRLPARRGPPGRRQPSRGTGRPAPALQLHGA